MCFWVGIATGLGPTAPYCFKNGPETFNPRATTPAVFPCYVPQDWTRLEMSPLGLIDSALARAKAPTSLAHSS